MQFDESKHKRDNDGKFAKQAGGENTNEINNRIKWARGNGVELPYNADGSLNDMKLQKLYAEKAAPKTVEVRMDTAIQRQFDNATPKERSKIAYRYIMDNLRGKYAADDGRTITISGVGADKMSHTTNETKIRVLPELARLIEAGKLQGIKDVEHKKFSKFAYYDVSFQIGKERYTALLNVGIRANGESTLYDINPFNKQ